MKDNSTLSMFNKNSSARVRVLNIIIFMGILVLLFYLFMTENTERIEKRNIILAEESALQNLSRVDDRLSSAMELINSYAYFLTHTLKEPEIPVTVLKEMEINSSFGFVGFTRADGMDLDSDGTERDYSDRNFYKAGMEGENGVEVIFDSTTYKQTVIAFYAPVYFNGKIIGVLHGIYGAERYLKHILESTYFGVPCDVFLCMPDGQIIANSQGQKYGGNIFKVLVKNRMIDEKAASEANRFFKEKNGIISDATQGTQASQIGIYHLPQQKYVLVQAFPQSVTDRMIAEANKSGIQLEVGLIILFFCQSIYLFARHAIQRKRLLKENREQRIIIDAMNILFAGRYILCNLDDKTYSYIAGSSAEHKAIPTTGDYMDMIDYQSSLLVNQDERKAFIEYFVPENLQYRFKNRDFNAYECEVKRASGDEWEILNTICVNRKDGKANFILFVRQNITSKKRRDLRLQKKISIMDRQERQYRLAVIDNAVYSYEINITKDLIDQDIFIERDNKKISLLASLGLSCPCQASEFFCAMLSNVLPESREEFSVLLNMDYLLNLFKKGQKEVDIQYWVTDFSGEEKCLRQAFYMTRDDLTNDVMAMAVTRDITTQVERQRAQTKALQDALMQARHANEAKTTFLSNMSHDIRTPMNAIIGFATIAASHLDNTEQVRDCLEKVLSSSNHLLSLINDILDMSRIESGKMQIKEQDCNLPEIMHSLVNIIQPQVKAKQLQMFIDTFEVINEDVITDPLKLNQIFINLLGNAVKYTPAGGIISFRIRQTPAFTHGFADFEFEVRDNGIGMSKEFVRHIFEPFSRESTTTQSGIQGTGLGMAITRNIIDMLNGTIEVKSEIGKGSVFKVKLTLKLGQKDNIQKQIAQLSGVRILVVDDDFHVCNSVDKMLKQIGMRSEWTTSGREAVQRAMIADNDNDPFNTYILDWHMPDLNGVETAKRIRKIAGKEAPIIILTAYDWSEIEKEAREAGITAFCAKPLFMTDLRNALLSSHKLIEEKQQSPIEDLDFGQKRILLVDDLELNREVAEFILTESGFVVEMAPDGTDAVEMVRNSEEGYYDAVLMDVQMPIMNGYEATRTIRNLNREDVKTLPIIAMTANALDEDKAAALKAGMNAHLSKPIEIKKFFEVLRQFFAAK